MDGERVCLSAAHAKALAIYMIQVDAYIAKIEVARKETPAEK